MALSVEIDKTVDKRDPFIEKLKDDYCNADGANKAEADKETKKWKDKLEAKKKELKELLTSEDIDDENVRTIAGNDLPSVWLVIAPEGNYEGEDIQAEGGLEDKKTRKKAAESGSGNLNQDNATMTQMASLNSKMPGIGETVADMVEPLYYTEYVLDMFSYYTVNRDRDGS